MSYENELAAAIAAVRAASEVCKGVQRDLVNAGTLEKKDKSPVSVADFASQAIVCAQLQKQFPGDDIVGEEDAHALRGNDEKARLLRESVAHHAGMEENEALAAIDHGSVKAESGDKRFWTLDPIDGTKGFLRGEQYAVALALIEHGEVVLGVLGCPNLDDDGLLLTAIRGKGAQRLPLAGHAADGQPIHVSDVDETRDARMCESVEPSHSDQDSTGQVIEALGITAEPYRIDSQCKYAVVSRGEASIYLRLPNEPGYVEKIWDHAAGALIVEEAGGTVTDVEGKPLDFGQGGVLALNKGVVATNGKLHDRVIDAIMGVLHH